VSSVGEEWERFYGTKYNLLISCSNAAIRQPNGYDQILNRHIQHDMESKLYGFLPIQGPV